MKKLYTKSTSVSEENKKYLAAMKAKRLGNSRSEAGALNYIIEWFKENYKDENNKK